MSERPFMQLYVSDFIGDTLLLSTEQIGAYMLLLMAMWNAGGTLPNDDAKLARITRMSMKKWRGVSDDLMAFFEVADDAITHDRLTFELQKVDRKSQSRAAAGAKGGAAKALKNKEPNLAIATPLLKHLPETRDHIEKKEPKGSQKNRLREGEKELGQTLRPEVARAVVDHRLKIKKPLTARAAELLAGKFGKCPDPNAAADHMIAQGWQGFEPGWMDRVETDRGKSATAQPDPTLVTLAQDHPDFLAVKRKRRAEEGRDVIVSATGKATISRAEVEQARKWVQDHDQGVQAQELAHAGSHH